MIVGVIVREGEAAGEDNGIGVVVEEVREAGAAAVPQGVEVALGRAGAGAATAAAVGSGCGERVVGCGAGQGGPPGLGYRRNIRTRVSLARG